MLLFWGTGLLLALVKIVIAGAFGLNISKKITEERSTLRKEFYIKFAKVMFCLFDSQNNKSVCYFSHQATTKGKEQRYLACYPYIEVLSIIK